MSFSTVMLSFPDFQSTFWQSVHGVCPYGQSPLGKIVFDKPYFVLVEAKQDNFDAAWGQCLAEMIAAQRLNENDQLVIFGITSNGDRWQFGKLDKTQFTLNKIFYTIQKLDHLFAAVNAIFRQCDHQLNSLIAA
jgi:hypothetical protein